MVLVRLLVATTGVAAQHAGDRCGASGACPDTQACMTSKPSGDQVCIPQHDACHGGGALDGRCCRAAQTGYFYTPGMGPFSYCCQGSSEARNKTKISSDPDTYIMTCCLPIESSDEAGTPCVEGNDCCGGFQPQTQYHPTVCRGRHPLSQPGTRRCMYCGTNNDGAYNTCQLDADCCPGVAKYRRVCVGAVNDRSDPSKDKAGRCCGGLDPDGTGDYCRDNSECCSGLVCKDTSSGYKRCSTDDVQTLLA